MPAPLLFVPGTWAVDRYGRSATADAFYARCVMLGLPIFDPDRPWWWSSALDGVIGPHTNWEAGALSLVNYVGRRPVSLVAHSHGGQVALRAARDLQIDLLVTVATPVRADIKPWIREARGNVREWTHFYSPRERGLPWQRLGSLFDGLFSPSQFFKWADRNVAVPDMGHSDLLACAPLWSLLENWYASLTDARWSKPDSPAPAEPTSS